MTRRIVLVDHGGRRAEANAATEAVGAALAARLGAPVAACHMEIAEPLYADVLARLASDPATTEIVVLPMFFVSGKHFVEDIEKPLADVARRRPGLKLRLVPPFTAQPQFLDYLAALAGRGA